MMIKVFTDGASKNNPGKAGCGAVAFCNDKILFEISKYLGIKTNNYAEYMAVVLALKRLIKDNLQNNKIVFYSDSQLVVNQINGVWKVKNNNIKHLFEEVVKLKNNFNNISFKYIPRTKNKFADSLANKAIKDEI